MTNNTRGTVIESTGSHYVIETSEGEYLEMRMRGKLRLNDKRTTNPIAVGDIVEYEISETGEAAITEILPRRNYLIRRASNLSKESHIIASNIDRVLIVATLFEPVTTTEFIDRCLVTCEAYGLPTTIVLNKLDLASEHPELLKEFISIYKSAGYETCCVSALTGEGTESLYELIADGTVLLTGNSGSGKSSLIKRLVPEAGVRIHKISDHHRKGMHTTTFARMYHVAGGGRIIDTPGIKGFGLVEITPDEIFRYFPEFMKYGTDCQYYNCTHTHEPGCAVVAAVEEGQISLKRYESYLKLLDEDGKYR